MAMSNALSSSLIPSVAQAAAVGDKRMMRARTASAIRFACVIAIPSAVGLTVLAGPINNLLFSGDNATAIQMTIFGSLAVVFYSVSTVTNAVLQGIDKMRLPIIHALISLVLHLGALELFFYVFDLGIYSMVYANILFAVFMCVLNAAAIRRYLKYRQELKKTILLPAAASAVMGGAAFGVYRAVFLFTKSNGISTILAVFAAILVYGLLLIKLGCLERRSFKESPAERGFFRCFGGSA